MNSKHIRIRKTSDPPLAWEKIEKVKRKNLPQQRKVTQYINQNKILIKANSLLVLEKIRNRITQEIKNTNTLELVGEIYRILADVDTLRVAYALIKTNKGSLTPGTDPTITADIFDEKKLQQISERLKAGEFRWKPVRRIMIEKPGKTQLRPLGLPDFDDKIVQGAIRLILEAIYEPIFEADNCNFGFRPNKDTTMALDKIENEAKHYQYVIEGDIKGAYDNVNQTTLITILSFRISDRKFLKLVEKGLKCGYMLDFKYHSTLLGTPQGSICSPILFNIYMREFDKFVKYTLKKMLLKQQLEQVQGQQSPHQTTATVTTKPVKIVKTEVSKDYEKIRSRIRKAQIRYNAFMKEADKWKTVLPEFFCDLAVESQYVQNLVDTDEKTYNYIKKYKEVMNLPTTTEKNELRTKRSNIRRQVKTHLMKVLTKEQLETLACEYKQQLLNTIKGNTEIKRKLPYLDSARLTLKMTYVRYADDWVLLVRGTKEMAERAKDLTAKFLQHRLSLTLSMDKTKITDLYNNKATFLGYELFYQRNKLEKKVEKPYNPTQRFSTLQFHPDSKRLESRFILKGYMTTNNEPREVGFLTPLQDHEIITKYNQFMMGLGNYYIRKISYPSRLNRWLYLLYFSCIKTLATKHKTTVKKIIEKYGYLDISNPQLDKRKPNATDIRIVAKYKFNNQSKWIVLYNYKEIMYNLNKLRVEYLKNKINKLPQRTIPEVDMLALHKVNFRTKFKETSFCAICGDQEQTLQNHHIRPLRIKKNQQFTGYRAFDKVVASLGRKQIPVCQKCHTNIHTGRYDGLKLEDIYDIRLIAPEGLIALTQETNPTITTTRSVGTSIVPQRLEIHENPRTYFNSEVKNYLINQHNGNT